MPPADPNGMVARINELSQTARTLWFGLLAYFAFVGVTLLGVTDADFFIPARQTQLPLIGVSIPTSTFFLFAPVLGAGFYTYLHHHLMKLWDALGRAAPMIGDQPLSDHLMPWIVTDLALDLRPDASLRPQPLRALANTVTVFLVFLAAPIVLALFWWRSMPAHSWTMTLLSGGLSLWFGLFVMAESGAALWRSRLGAASETHHKHGGGRRFRRVTFWAGCLVVISALGYARAVEPLGQMLGLDAMYARYLASRDAAEIADARASDDRQRLNAIAARHDDALLGATWNRAPFVFASARLRDVIFVAKPAGWRDFQTARAAFRVTWCRNEGLPPEVCGPVPTAGADLPPFLDDQRRNWCQRMFRDPDERAALCPPYLEDLDRRFAADWDIERQAASSDLPKSNLAGTDLRNADLAESEMEGTLLAGSQMQGADLTRVQMEGADLRGAQMQAANLSEAQMEGANLSGAQMENAVLIDAQLEGADLSAARLAGAVLIDAQMEGANLAGAQMERAVLAGAQLERANLSGAQMEGAVLARARLEGALLAEANLRSADLSGWSIARGQLRAADMTGALNLRQSDVDTAWGDCSTILPEGIARPRHWDSRSLDYPYDDDPAYRAWLAAGAPPGKPGLVCPDKP